MLLRWPCFGVFALLAFVAYKPCEQVVNKYINNANKREVKKYHVF